MKNVDVREDPRKQQKIESVTSVEELEGKSWDRDRLERRFQDVRTTHNNIVRIIQDIQSELDSLPGIDDVIDEARSNDVYENMPKENGDPKYHPSRVVEVARRRSELKDREVRWMAELMELHRFAERRFKDKGLSILEEYRSSKVRGKLEEHLDESIEDKIEKRIAEEKTEINQVKSEVKSVAQAMREEKRSLWNLVEDIADSDYDRLSVQDVEEAQVEGLERFVTENGLGFSIDGDVLDKDETESERKEAAESNVGDVSGEEDVDGDEENQDNGFEIEEDKLTANQIEFLKAALDIQGQDKKGDLQDIADKADIDFSVASKYIGDIRKKNHDLPSILQELG